MKKNIIFIILMLLIFVSKPAFSALVYPGSDLIYKGAFRVSYDNYTYAKISGMTYWPDGGALGTGSLIITGSQYISSALDTPQMVAEIEIPAPIILELLTLDVAPGGAGWSVGNTVTGVTSTETCVIVGKTSTTVYTVKDRSGDYTLGEVLTNGTATADQGALYPIVSRSSSTRLSYATSLNNATIRQTITDITAYQGIPGDCVGLDDPYDCCTGSSTGCSSSETSPRLKSVEYVPAGTKAGLTEDKLLYVLLNDYSPIPTESTIGWSNLDFGSGVINAGNWKVADVDNVAVGDFIFYIDQDWADVNTSGQSIGVGRYRPGYGAAPSGSYGPSLYTVAPWASCTGDPVDCENNPPAIDTSLSSTQLLYWDTIPHTLSEASHSDKYYDAQWIKYGEKECLVFSALKTGRPNSGATTDSYYYGFHGPEGQGSKGYNEEPYYGELLFFDPADLASPPNGHTYEIQPYARFPGVSIEFNPYKPPLKQISLFADSSYERYGFGGMAFDSTNGYLYVVESGAYSETSAFPVIHVFEISSDASTQDVTAPTNPSSLTATSVNKTTATIGWTASTDANDDVIYHIKINGLPIFMTDETAITHYSGIYAGNPSYYIAPVTYSVTAWDKEENKSSSASISIDATDGVSDPIAFFISGEYNSPTGASCYDITISELPRGVVGVPYSYTPKIEANAAVTGGWSLYLGTLQSGLSINADTGEISGTASTVATSNLIIQVQDVNGNIYKRMCQLSIVSATSTIRADRDYDGYYTTDCVGLDNPYDWCPGAGTDTDDQDYRVNPSNPTVTTPTGVELTGTTMSWTMSTEAVVAGYIVYSGTATGVYPNQVFVGYTNSYDLSESEDGYFAVAAIDFYGLESATSDEIIKTPTSAVTGTIIAGYVIESEIVAGSQTVIISLTNDTWETFDNTIRAAIVAGMDSAQSEAAGWDAKIKADPGSWSATGVVRTSATVCTITLPASADYSISSNETITVTIPASALVTSTAPVVATPTILISNETTAASTERVVGYGASGQAGVYGAGGYILKK